MPESDNSLPPSAHNLRDAFSLLVDTLAERGIRYAIIGGLATIQHTRVRATDDIDALLTIPQIAIAGLFDALVGRGFTINAVTSIREFLDHGMTTIRFRDVAVDLLRPVLPAYSRVLDRAITANMLGRTVRISSAEGLIVMKMMALRPQDQADIKELLRAHAGELDLSYIRAEIATFMDADDPRVAEFESWVVAPNGRG